VTWCGLPTAKSSWRSRGTATRRPFSNRVENKGKTQEIGLSILRGVRAIGRPHQRFYAETLPELCQLAARQIAKSSSSSILENLRMRSKSSTVYSLRGSLSRHLARGTDDSRPLRSSLVQPHGGVERPVESTLMACPVFCVVGSMSGTTTASSLQVLRRISARFSAADREIPQLLENFHITDAVRQGLQTSITAELLESVLSGK